LNRVEVVTPGDLKSAEPRRDESRDGPPSASSAPAPRPDEGSRDHAATEPVVVETPVHLLMGAAILRGQPVSKLYPLFKSRRAASSAIRETEDLKQIDCPKVPHGGKGANLKLIRLTDLGWERLAPHGIQRPPSLVQGGDLHDFAAMAIRTLAQQQGEETEFEVPYASARLDAVWRRAGKPDLMINIGVSDMQREADALERLLTHTAERFVHVGINKRFNQGVARRLKAAVTDQAERVEYRLLGALVKKAYLHTDG
jgi:hypothetical protein